MDAVVVEIIGDTTAPEGCESFQVRITENKREPVEVICGCTNFKLSFGEAEELGRLLVRAGRKERSLRKMGGRKE